MAETAKRTKRSARRRAAGADTPPLEAAPLRGRLRALRPAQADALRTFFSAPQRWYLAEGGLLHFMPGDARLDAAVFELDAEGTRLGLRLQAGEVLAGDGLHWSDYTGRSRLLAWSLAHEPHLMRLGEALGVALAPLAESAPGDPPDEDALWLDFVIDDSAGGDEDAARRPPATQGSLRLPAAWLERLLARAEPPVEGEPPPPLGRWRELPATVSLQLALPPLPGADWALLRQGDVIVAGRRGRPPQFEAHACGRLWPLAATAQGWRIDGPAQHQPRPQETATMTETPAEAVADGEDQDADAGARQLPVQVAFEIGRLEMRVGEVSALQPGYVFALPAHLEGSNVVIRANGEAVGQGEVVAVGDTLGVRLLNWT
ncbi:type III secretion system cytoplasmic ring protein SctQ [Luteimonas sp. RD2P54]|uniref:Type III secretion system cytoplasmic ring protein SctQ n=1 Tax=Luteimonas endophytica TaxID=3042023 RepID=A0ABT6J608_9GAMM|nr:type III secretion system cytoplasmic ring protein SctQ [Luteimonas endophytica]MDH5822035.1 type III secretion system cytoplasmic ring protein SctQ [Luteimonas endophytica]